MSVLAWHWSDGMACRYDGRPIVTGGTLRVEGALVLCQRGLHASVGLLDSLAYAPGTTLHRVRLSGEILRGADKLAASERTVLWTVDMREPLLEWSRAIVRGLPDSQFGAYTLSQRLAHVEDECGWGRAAAANALHRAVHLSTGCDPERPRKNAALLRKLAVRNRK